jgi:hypothetical protein
MYCCFLRCQALEQLLDTADLAQQVQRFESLASLCEGCLRSQQILIDVKPPCKVFGDIHGQVMCCALQRRVAVVGGTACVCFKNKLLIVQQLRDLLLLFREFGFPSHRHGDVECVNYIFNGDFVDRGAHQLECVVSKANCALMHSHMPRQNTCRFCFAPLTDLHSIHRCILLYSPTFLLSLLLRVSRFFFPLQTLLFALKVLYPEQITLLRGNHEFREQNECMGETGFLGVCHAHMRDQNLAWRFYEAAHQVYQALLRRSFFSHSRVLAVSATVGLSCGLFLAGRCLNRLSPFLPLQSFEWLPLSALVGESILVLHGGS